MNISRFFIDRPIFAAVIAVFITLVGVFAYPLLPLSQYPEIAPPTITINAAYPGASAETLAETVAAPIEQEVNGVEDMLYITSSSTSDGAVAITVTFQPGTLYWQRFGHNAQLLSETTSGRSVTFIYGIFDFGAPDFFLNFARGHMTYRVVPNTLENDLRHYQAERRWAPRRPWPPCRASHDQRCDCRQNPPLTRHG